MATEEQEIMQRLDERKHPKKYAVKRGLQRASDFLNTAAEKLEQAGREKFDRTDYDKNADFDSLSAEQQATAIADKIVEKRDRKEHPAKYKLADFINGAAKVFASGADKIVYKDNKLAKHYVQGRGGRN